MSHSDKFGQRDVPALISNGVIGVVLLDGQNQVIGNRNMTSCTGVVITLSRICCSQ